MGHDPRAHPDCVMDNCAAGGRRIDLEMCMRSIVQTRSDSGLAPNRADSDQAQTCGLSLFLPVHATIGWSTAAYDCRSSATAGFLGEWDILDPKFPVEGARTRIAEIRRTRISGTATSIHSPPAPQPPINGWRGNCTCPTALKAWCWHFAVRKVPTRASKPSCEDCITARLTKQPGQTTATTS